MELLTESDMREICKTPTPKYFPILIKVGLAVIRIEQPKDLPVNTPFRVIKTEVV